MQFSFFNGMPQQDQFSFQKMMDICSQHPECKGCPYIGGNPLDENDIRTICETGVNKHNEEPQAT